MNPLSAFLIAISLNKAYSQALLPNASRIFCDQTVLGHIDIYEYVFTKGIPFAELDITDTYYFQINNTMQMIIDGCDSLNDYYLYLYKYDIITNEWLFIDSDPQSGGRTNGTISTCPRFKGLLLLPNITEGSYQLIIESYLFSGSVYGDYTLTMICLNATNQSQSASQTITTKWNNTFSVISADAIYKSESNSLSDFEFVTNISKQHTLNCYGQCWTQINNVLYFIHKELVNDNMNDISIMLTVMDLNSYDVSHSYLLFEQVTIEYEDGYCLTNNVSHVFVIISNTFYSLDVHTNILRQHSSLHMPRYYAGCAYADIDGIQSVFVFGGFISIHHTTFMPQCPTFSIEKYDIFANKWVISNSSILKVMRGEVFVLTDSERKLFYILNGYDHFDNFVNYIEIFDFEQQLMVNVLYTNNSLFQAGPVFDYDYDSIYLFDIRQNDTETYLVSNSIDIENDILQLQTNNNELEYIITDPFYTHFVDYCGDNNPHLECGSLRKPCGSLSVMLRYLTFKLQVFSFYPIAIPTAHIYVSSPTNPLYSDELCYFNLQRANIIITFNNITISSTYEWFPSIKNCIYNESQTNGTNFVHSVFRAPVFIYDSLPVYLTLNYMIWDINMNDNAVPFIQNSIEALQYFRCNNCIFSDFVVKKENFFKIQHGYFYQCKFYNIVVLSSSFLLSGSFEMNIPNKYQLIFNECSFINISASSNYFIQFVSGSDILVDSQPQLMINNCDIYTQHLTLFIGEEMHSTQIISSRFIGFIVITQNNLDSIGLSESRVIIYDTYIQQTQHYNIRYNTEHTEQFYPSIRTAINSILQIQNVSVIFTTECYSNVYYNQIGIYCESPMTFLENNGITILHNISFQTE
eukprot:199361_1